jgi:hypothetical protein
MSAAQVALQLLDEWQSRHIEHLCLALNPKSKVRLFQSINEYVGTDLTVSRSVVRRAATTTLSVHNGQALLSLF